MYRNSKGKQQVQQLRSAVVNLPTFLSWFSFGDTNEFATETKQSLSNLSLCVPPSKYPERSVKWLAAWALLKSYLNLFVLMFCSFCFVFPSISFFFLCFMGFSRSLRPGSKVCSEHKNDWQYLSLGDLQQNEFFPKSKSWGFLVP